MLGRTFDSHILDMLEFGVENYLPISEFNGAHKAIGSKPLLVFLGDQWTNDSTYSKVQSVLLDFFRGEKIEKVALKGLDHVICVSIIESRIHVRLYSLAYKKSGTKVSVKGFS